MKKTLTDTTVRKISRAIFGLMIFAALSPVFAQKEETNVVKPEVVVTPLKQKIRQRNRPVTVGALETFAEKSIRVDAKVNISLCVAEGRLKVTGWERSEIRAFVGGSGDVGFKVLQKNKQNNAVWVMVVNSGAPGGGRNREECLSGEEIELDVPRGATVNVKGRSSETTIEMVRKADVRNVGGDISLNNIEQGINAATYEGDVTVENSGGAIALETANGNIVALDVAPSEIGDIFKAKTISGAITLQNIEHRQTEISSNSGSIKFTGEFQTGGQYNFGTQNGTIQLAIPEKSSCKISASYGYGKFSSDIKLNIITINNSSKAQSIAASLGNGDANVNLTTYSGAIRIKKQ